MTTSLSFYNTKSGSVESVTPKMPSKKPAQQSRLLAFYNVQTGEKKSFEVFYPASGKNNVNKAVEAGFKHIREWD